MHVQPCFFTGEKIETEAAVSKDGWTHRGESYHRGHAKVMGLTIPVQPPAHPGLLPSQSLVETSSRSPEVSLTAFSAQPPDLPTGALDGCGLRYTVQTRPTPYASIRFLFIGSRLCFHASFRRPLTETPLRFAITSPPSGCERDFHPQAVRHARHTRRLNSPACAAFCAGPVE